MSIQGIYRAVAASAPMESLETAGLMENQGLEGDRYASFQGTYSTPRLSAAQPGEREPGRQLTLISGDSVQAA
jgi:hypothetical protein